MDKNCYGNPKQLPISVIYRTRFTVVYLYVCKSFGFWLSVISGKAMTMQDLFRYMYYLYIIASPYIFIDFSLYFDVLAFKPEATFSGDLVKELDF